MKLEFNYLSTYFLIYILATIIFIKTIIEIISPTENSKKKNNNYLINNFELIKSILNIPLILIIFYLCIKYKLNNGLKILFLLSLLSILINYLFERKYIYKFVDKKYLNQNLINFIDIRLDLTVDVVILLIYFYVLIKY